MTEIGRLIQDMDKAQIFIDGDDCTGYNIWDDLKREIAAMTDSKMPVATVTHITPGIIADGKQDRGITLNWRATEDLKIGSKLYAHPAPVADAELIREVERIMADYDANPPPDDENGMSASINLGPEYFRKIVTTLRARTAQPVGVRVKPLEWVERDDDSYWAAVGCGTMYYIRCYAGMKLPYRLTPSVSLDAAFETLQAAKAAAQADYEQRILSALLPEGGA